LVYVDDFFVLKWFFKARFGHLFHKINIMCFRKKIFFHDFYLFISIFWITAVAKAIYIYCNFMAFYIYLMTNNNIEICRGANRVKLKGLLGPLIRETCLLQPGPLTPYVYEVEWNGFNFFPDIGRVEYGVWFLATVPVVKYSRGWKVGMAWNWALLS